MSILTSSSVKAPADASSFVLTQLAQCIRLLFKEFRKFDEPSELLTKSEHYPEFSRAQNWSMISRSFQPILEKIKTLTRRLHSLIVQMNNLDPLTKIKFQRERFKIFHENVLIKLEEDLSLFCDHLIFIIKIVNQVSDESLELSRKAFHHQLYLINKIKSTLFDDMVFIRTALSEIITISSTFWD